MRGPEFFDRHADLSELGPQIAAMAPGEGWRPLTDAEARACLDPETTPERSRGIARLWRLTLNGHLLPFFGLFGRRVVLVQNEDRNAYWVWGAREITFVAKGGAKGYTTRQSKRRFFGVMLRTLALALRFIRRYAVLRADYRARYPEMTTRRYWEGKLGL